MGDKSRIIIDYYYVAAPSVDMLVDSVRRVMVDEWQPNGGILFDGRLYYQPLIKYKPVGRPLGSVKVKKEGK